MSKSLFGDAGDGFTKRGNDEEVDLDITPMIDVTFLLLIFFMVTSTMQAEKDREVPVAKYGVGVDTRGARTIIIYNPSGGDPEIELDGAEGTLEEVKGFSEETIQLGVNHIIIKADREVPHGFVTQVTKAVMEIEGMTFSIGVRDKKGEGG